MSLLLLLFACTSAPPLVPDDDTDTDVHTDTDVPPDTDTAETGQDTDDGCLLSAELDGTAIQGGETIAFPDAPALGSRRHRVLSLQNTCTQTIRFLGYPDDWITGSGFAVDELPPVLIEPGESTAITLTYQPDQEGSYSGGFSLPYDRPSSPFSVDLAAQVTGPLTMVLVGDGIMATTQDYGATFTEVRLTTESHSNELRRGVCWGLGHFVATGGSDERRMWSSPDGLDWTEINQASGWVADCASNGSQVVAAGGSHRLAETTDMATWSLGGEGGGHFRAVAYGDGHYVAVGDSEAGVSTDGVTWLQVQTLDVVSMGDIAFGNGVFAAVGNGGWVTASSDNGATWSSSQLASGGFSTIVFDGENFYAGDGASVFRSADGLAWDRVNSSGGVVPRGAVGTTLFGTGSGGFYRSVDHAFSWELLYTFTNGSGFNDAVFAGEE